MAKRKANVPHAMNSKEHIAWVVQNMIEIERWCKEGKELVDYPFPEPGTYAHAQAILDDPSNLKDFLKQRVQAENRAEGRVSSRVKDDFRRHMDVLRNLARVVRPTGGA